MGTLVGGMGTEKPTLSHSTQGHSPQLPAAHPSMALGGGSLAVSVSIPDEKTRLSGEQRKTSAPPLSFT